MSPQAPEFNRRKWRELEQAVRVLNDTPSVLETYVITGPVFDFNHRIRMIGQKDRFGTPIPVPSHFFKCILAEEKSGKIRMWAFEMENTRLDGCLADYQVRTSYVERRAGILLWDNLSGTTMEKEKNRVRTLWSLR